MEIGDDTDLLWTCTAEDAEEISVFVLVSGDDASISEDSAIRDYMILCKSLTGLKQVLLPPKLFTNPHFSISVSCNRSSVLL